MSIEKIVGIDYWNPTLWEFSFDSIGSDLRYYVKNVNLPFISLDKEQRNTGYSYYTGYTPEEDFTITFIDNSNLYVLDFLRRWQDSIFDYEQRVFKQGNHTKTGTLIIQKFIGNEGLANGFLKKAVYETVKTYVFHNMMLVGIENIELDYEDGNAKTITATFECDAVKENSNIVLAGAGAFIT